VLTWRLLPWRLEKNTRDIHLKDEGYEEHRCARCEREGHRGQTGGKDGSISTSCSRTISQKTSKNRNKNAAGTGHSDHHVGVIEMNRPLFYQVKIRIEYKPLQQADGNIQMKLMIQVDFS